MSDTSPVHTGSGTEVEFCYPFGHEGHLSPEQEVIFQDFKQCCYEKGYYEPASDTSEASHDNATLLRFLRARRFDIPSAIQQFTSDVDWRRSNSIDEHFETMDVKFFEETNFLYPQWTGRCDRRGIPVFLYDVKQLNSSAMATYDELSKSSHSNIKNEDKKFPKYLRLFALYENMVKFVMPLCSAVRDRKYPNTPISQCCNLVDVSGVGLKQFWNLRAHMLDTSALANVHYPETLDRIIIIGTPTFFPMVWGWIQKWFDANTTSKILILGGSDISKKLASIIELRNIPKKYGGQLEFECGDRPQLDDSIKEIISWEDGWTDFPLSPIRWVNKGDSMEAYAVGSISGVERRERICIVRRSPMMSLEDCKKCCDQPEASGNKTLTMDNSKPVELSGSLTTTDPLISKVANSNSKNES